MTNRQLIPLLLIGGLLLAAPAVAQKKSSDGWGDAGDGWGTPAPKKAAATKAVPAKTTSTKPATKTSVNEPVVAPAPVAASAGSEWGGAAGAAPATASASAVDAEQPIGASIAPGFTAAPSRRVTTDYRGRQLAPYVRRSVRSTDIAPPVMAAPAPIALPEPEPEPVAAAPAPMPTAKPAASKATASAGTKSGGTAAAATTKKAAPAKKAPAKKADDGWGSGGSGW